MSAIEQSEVEAILGHQYSGVSRTYFVKLKGRPESERYWIKGYKINQQKIKDLVAEYEASLKERRRKAKVKPQPNP